MLILAKLVPAAKSLLVLVCTGPFAKIRSSPAKGAIPPAQLAAVCQFVSPTPAPPLQNKTAGAERSSSCCRLSRVERIVRAAERRWHRGVPRRLVLIFLSQL